MLVAYFLLMLCLLLRSISLLQIRMIRLATFTGLFYRTVGRGSARCDHASADKLSAGEFATNVIMAYGGGDWVDAILGFGSGTNEQAIQLFKSGNGMCHTPRQTIPSLTHRSMENLPHLFRPGLRHEQQRLRLQSRCRDRL